jgi:hypothetical protein
MRLRARCTFGSSRFIAVAAAMVMALSVLFGTSAASASSTVTSRYFGMHAPGLDSSFPSVHPGSVNLTLNHVYWRDLQPQPGVAVDFARLEPLVVKAEENHARPLLVLGQTPDWASTNPQSVYVPGTIPTMPAWRDYVTAVASEYGTRLDYQIWPEANAGNNWQGTMAQLAPFVKVASQIIHHFAPHAIVVSPAMVIRNPAQMKRMTTFFAQKVNGTPIGRYVDAVAIDAYPQMDGAPEDSAALIRSAHRMLAARKATAPLWNVEINYGVFGSHVPVAPFSASKQASYVARNYLLNAANGVKRVYWLAWANITEVGIQMLDDHGVPTSASAAYAQVERWMLGRQVRSCAQARQSRVWTCTLAQGKRLSRVYWRASRSAIIASPKGARRVEPLGGVARSATKRLKVTSTPIWVH